LALERFTAEFEMGSGMDTPPKPPGRRKTGVNEHVLNCRTLREAGPDFLISNDCLEIISRLMVIINNESDSSRSND
jgi:hypothetical protein